MSPSCQVCGQPWGGAEVDGYELGHRELEALLTGRGCPARDGYPCAGASMPA